MRVNISEKHAELYGLDRPVKLRGCDCPGCGEVGHYRAPKSRDLLNEYYWFCLAHARQYNESWDYYAGMSQAEIEAHIRFDATWQRATQPLGARARMEEALREKVQEEFFAGEEAAFAGRDPRSKADEMPATIAAALTVLELKPPVTLEAIRAQYKLLVKKHHPDANGGSKQAEEKFKIINQAFAVLKASFDADSTD